MRPHAQTPGSLPELAEEARVLVFDLKTLIRAIRAHLVQSRELLSRLDAMDQHESRHDQSAPPDHPS